MMLIPKRREIVVLDAFWAYAWAEIEQEFKAWFYFIADSQQVVKVWVYAWA